MKKNKILYYSLIITFTLLYLLIACVSTLHAISFFQIGNMTTLAVLLGVAFETGQSSVLFAILMSENRKTTLAWFTMVLLTSVQISANIYASFKHMDKSGTNDWTYWQRSVLFWVQADSPEMYKVIIAWIQGAILPIVALALTSLVTDNIRIMKEQTSDDNRVVKEVKEDEIYPEEEELLLNTKEQIPIIIEKRAEKPKQEELGFQESDYELAPIENNNSLPLNYDVEEKIKEEKKPELIIEKSKEIIKEQIQPKERKKREKKVIITPVNTIRGWHLLKEFVDNEFNVFSKGKFIENNPDKIPSKKE